MRKQSTRYIDIALNIATLIVNGELSEGDKVSGRSTLAGRYNVSPETVRRAVTLLKESGVVDSSPKSGISILSAYKAHEFILQYQKKTSMTTLRNEIESIMLEKKQLESQLMDKVKYMLTEMTTAREIGTILPLEAMVPEGSIVIGRTIGKCRFWHQTGATIIGVKRNGNVHLSPGPDWEIEALDIVIFIGKKDVQKRVHELLRTQ